MNKTRFYFVRHGESEANLLNVFSNRGTKHGLTLKGKQQVYSLAKELKSDSICRLYSSPLLRAKQTAEILAEELAIPWVIIDALREYDCGVLEGKSDQNSWDKHISVLENWIERGQWECRIERGESFNEIKERFLPFVDKLVEQYRGSNGGLVLVGHGGIYRIMLPLIFDNIDFNLVMDHAIKNTGFVLAEVNAGGLLCLSWDGIELK